jgi:hypothetical protein
LFFFSHSAETSNDSLVSGSPTSIGEGFNGLDCGTVTAAGVFSTVAVAAVLVSGDLTSVAGVVFGCCTVWADVCVVLSADEGVWAERDGVIRVRTINAINTALDIFFIISFLSYLILFLPGISTDF